MITSKQRTTFLLLTDDHTSAPGSFIFSLRNNDDLPPFKAPLKDENDGRAIGRYNHHGPIFGDNHDLDIINEAGSSMDSSANFGFTYKPPSGYTYGHANTSALLAGSHSYTPSEAEVLYSN